jgi:hypothetical protein
MTQKFTSDSPTFDEIRALRKPRTETVWVPLDSDLMERIEELEKQIRVEERVDDREHRTPVAPRLRRELDDLIAAGDAAAVPFRMQELPRRTYRTLVDMHPAGDDDKARNITRWNEDAFAPVLIAACCVDPVLTSVPREEFLGKVYPGARAVDLRALAGPAVEVWDEWATSIAYVLFGAAYELQEGGAKVPFTVRRSSETPASQPISTTAPTEE